MRGGLQIIVGGASAMRSVVLSVCLWSLMAAALLFPAAAQEQEDYDPKTTTRVTLGSSSGTPGTSVVVPIYFMPAEGVEVGRLKLDMSFVSASLKFSKIDAGIAAELGNVDLSNELKVGENEKGLETSTLTIIASFLSPEPPQKGIPAGLLGYLTMRIDEDARPASISLHATAEAAELGSNKPLENLRAFDAKVDVLVTGSELEPMVVCFFFSH